MLRVADRDAKWAKWRAMASGMLDNSKLGRALTVGNVGAAGALAAAVGVGVLGSRYVAESQKREEVLRLALDSAQKELTRTLEEQHEKLQEQLTGLEKKFSDKHQASLRKGRALLDKYTEARRLASQTGDAVRSKATEETIRNLVDASFSKAATTLRRDSAGVASLDLAAVLLAVTAEVDRAERAAREAILASENLEIKVDTGLEATQLILREFNSVSTELQLLQSRVVKLEEVLALTTSGAQQRFGSAPLGLILGRALSAVSLPDRPEVARQMARVILATAALEAHRETRASDLYTTDRAD